jgi:pimeloyl-ACP methyl ester carboxylesterase
VIRIRHGRVSLVLHALHEAPGPTLLFLHAVGGSAADFRRVASAWPGCSFGLDFVGHGASDALRGGAYHPEILVGDADTALARIGSAHVAGAGIGAYVALLLAGARPDLVPAALLLPGAGLDGGGVAPDPESDGLARWAELAPPLPGCDPAVRRLERDIRPPDYAGPFARAARRLLLAEDGSPRPPWWCETRESPTSEEAPLDLGRALALLAGRTDRAAGR